MIANAGSKVHMTAVVHFLAGFALSLAATAGRAADPHLEASLAEAMESNSPPAMGVLVIRDHKVTGQAVYGVRELGRADSVQIADRWQIASDVKPFTATLIARLVEQGRLSWNAPLSRLLPDHASAMHAEYRDVTLLDLLSHRSGIGDLKADDPLFLSFYKDSRPLPRQRAAWAAAALSRPPIITKRSKPSYSNSGFIIAALVAEKATAIPFERLMEREILKPLKLTSATFAPATQRRELLGHVDGRPAGPRDLNPLVMNPSSNLRLSLQDWARFCLDQMAGRLGRGKLLSAASYRLLHTGQGGTEEGLGWGVAADFAGRQGPVIQHTGHDGNWFAAVALFPEPGDGVLIVANAGRSMGGEAAVLRVAMPIVSGLSEAVVRPVKVPPDRRGSD